MGGKEVTPCGSHSRPTDRTSARDKSEASCPAALPFEPVMALFVEVHEVSDLPACPDQRLNEQKRI
jgi:hypothetical protein